MLYGLLAYVLWGAFAAYFPLLEPAGAVEILSHRIIWTLVTMLLVLLARRRLSSLKLITRRMWAPVALAALLIAANWLIYVFAVNSGHVAEAALGYFINPLVSVLLGMVFLKERLSRLQALSVATAAFAVVMLTVVGGHPPLIGLGLALSFGFYGLVKSKCRCPPRCR